MECGKLPQCSGIFLLSKDSGLLAGFAAHMASNGPVSGKPMYGGPYIRLWTQKDREGKEGRNDIMD